MATAGVPAGNDEEVIGDIDDEYDMVTRESVEVDGILEPSGSLSLIDVRTDDRVSIPEGDWTTLGGYGFSGLGRLPRVGDLVLFPGGDLEVIAMDGRRVAGGRVNRGRTAS